MCRAEHSEENRGAGAAGSMHDWCRVLAPQAHAARPTKA